MEEIKQKLIEIVSKELDKKEVPSTEILDTISIILKICDIH